MSTLNLYQGELVMNKTSEKWKNKLDRMSYNLPVLDNKGQVIWFSIYFSAINQFIYELIQMYLSQLEIRRHEFLQEESLNGEDQGHDMDAPFHSAASGTWPFSEPDSAVATCPLPR